MTNTVILTVGASSSGKTTWSKAMAAADSNIVVTNRDDIRRMQGFPTLGSREQEQTVTTIQRGIIETALLAGKDVIVSDTNINKQFRKHLIKFCHEHGANVRLVIFDVPWETLVERTKGRPQNEQVPEPAMRKQFDSLATQLKDGTLDQREFLVQSYEPYKAKGPDPEGRRQDAVVVDIDGTVANHYGNRSPYDYSKVGTDTTHDDVIKIVEALHAAGHHIIFLSGRDDVCENDTQEWIERNILLDNYSLYMRSTGDTRPDWIIKNELYDKVVIPNHDILCVLDDRDQVVRHLRRRGIRVLQVAPGRF